MFRNAHPIIRRKPSLFFFFIAVVVIMLIAGLKPRGYRIVNRVNFSPDGNGLRLTAPSIIFSKNIQPFKPLCAPDISFTIEMRLTPSHNRTFDIARIISFCDSMNKERVIFGQFNHALIVKVITDHKKIEFGCDSIFEGGMETTIAMASNKSGIKIFKDGVLKKSFLMRFANPEYVVYPLRIVIGNAPDGQTAWEGLMSGIRVYNKVLPEEKMVAMNKPGTGFSFKSTIDDLCLLNYDFTNVVDRSVKNKAGPYPDLIVPIFFTILDKHILSAPWKDWIWDADTKLDFIVNFIGFMPFGFLLSCLLLSQGLSGKKTLFITLSAGALFSLFIELAQVFIPTRHSQLSDLFLNTFGAFCGAALFVIIGKKIAIRG
jgi:hypothetical protein